ncbi:cell wall hydrolase [Novosphingobium lentum]|uniref:cell wall hydrolase n=1 Tax=Novosphingobium lentum TaxID=145287 RepID=UPI000B32A96C
MIITTLVSSGGSGAAAQVYNAPAVATPAIATQVIEAPAMTASASPDAATPHITTPYPVQPLADATASADDEDDAPDDVRAGSLAQLVSQTSVPQQLSGDLACLAGAIYFEAKGESLDGQLAVGRVIIDRAHSGRFPASICGVVYQPSQFSFVRGAAMPAINHASAMWAKAVRVARIALDGSWKSPVEGALFFHAARVSPNWRLKRIAQVDNHVFYR